jgi:single-strand DNA-binding protein
LEIGTYPGEATASQGQGKEQGGRAMNATAITLSGNLVADPELRYTPTGTPVANFRVASTERYKGEDGWQDGDTLFLTVNAWRDLAEHAAETLHRGDRVIVTGRIRQRTYERDGSNVQVTEVEATDVGVSLQRVTAKLAKAQRSTGNGEGNGDAPPF